MSQSYEWNLCPCSAISLTFTNPSKWWIMLFHTDLWQAFRTLSSTEGRWGGYTYSGLYPVWAELQSLSAPYPRSTPDNCTTRRHPTEPSVSQGLCVVCDLRLGELWSAQRRQVWGARRKHEPSSLDHWTSTRVVEGGQLGMLEGSRRTWPCPRGEPSSSWARPGTTTDGDLRGEQTIQYTVYQIYINISTTRCHTFRKYARQ